VKEAVYYYIIFSRENQTEAKNIQFYGLWSGANPRGCCGIPSKNPKFPKTGGCNKFVSGSDLCTQEKWLNGFSKKTGGPLCTLAGRKHAGLDLPHIYKIK